MEDYIDTTESNETTESPSVMKEIAFCPSKPFQRTNFMYLTGNSSILLNVLAWFGLWCAISFGVVAIYIVLCELSRWLNRRSLNKFNKRFDALTEEYNNDVL